MSKLEQYIRFLYPEQHERVFKGVMDLIEKWKQKPFPSYPWVDNGDVLLITYGDGIKKEGEAPLKTLRRFMDSELKGYLNLIHLLPMFPYTSDDGFSVVDFRKINPDLGDWGDIEALGESYELMFDAVLNHASKSSGYFQEYLKCNPKYRDFFITCDPKADYSMVTRPRTSPLLTAFDTKEGEKYVWTTFSDDQIDLNYKNPDVLLEMLDVLLLYAQKGARFVRFDAIGFAWKEDGTTCMHLPQVHTLVKCMREVLQACAPGCTIITETNVPHKQNISYFGDGHDEAGLVYQFPLPPLTLYSFLSGRADKLSQWAASLEPTTGDTTFFNFLASHDGIGMRPVEDILDDAQKQMMADEALRRGGQIGYRTTPEGKEVPYELNINYLDAVAGDETDRDKMVQKFMASQCILLSFMGLPAIYYHSLLGSRNCYEEVEKSGIKRRINREKLDFDKLLSALYDEGSLRHQVLSRYKALIEKRKEQRAFAPNSPQQVLTLDGRVLSLLRGEGEGRVLALINVSGETVRLNTPYSGTDLLTGKEYHKDIKMSPYEYLWLKLK